MPSKVSLRFGRVAFQLQNNGASGDFPLVEHQHAAETISRKDIYEQA
jgi:hypothetical protein